MRGLYQFINDIMFDFRLHIININSTALVNYYKVFFQKTLLENWIKQHKMNLESFSL